MVSRTTQATGFVHSNGGSIRQCVGNAPTIPRHGVQVGMAEQRVHRDEINSGSKQISGDGAWNGIG